MNKEMAARVLGHQLNGIMLHVDLCKAYILHKKRRCAMKHFNHLMSETKNHMLTNQYIIESLGEIVEPSRTAQIILPAEEEKLFEIWQQYERDTAAFYRQLMDEEPHCCWWKKLHSEAMKEIYHTKIL